MLIALTMALALGQEPARPSFAEWLAGVRAEAIARGLKEQVVDEALADVTEPQPVILERDRSQAETVFSLEKYIGRILTPKLIASGRTAMESQRALLDRVSERYGVSGPIIVAIWGMESNFGRFSGIRPTVPALATLAWDPRRATFFRGELLDALEILNRGDIDLPRLKGSWAGAMGQVQFMPSSYLKFAEDFDGDGKRDIWSTPADVLASIANYLKGHGWTANQSWGREVKVAPDVAKRIARDVAPRSGTCKATRDMTVPLPMSRWRELGVRLPKGQALPKGDEVPASLVSGTTRHFLVNPNYDAILEYNCAHSYAISVALLGDAIASDTAPAASKSAKPKHKTHR
jgi:membrane-bound lytic murein transglycosylase B